MTLYLYNINMLQIVIGLTIILAIVVLTVFILSIQHISFSSIFQKHETSEDVDNSSNDYSYIEQEKSTNNDDVTETEVESSTTTQVSNEETAQILLTEGKSTEEILTELQNQNIEEQRCCFINKFIKKDNTWQSGVERRCNEFADKSCEETLYNCHTILEKKPCNDNMLCEFDKETSKCKNIPNAHEGSEITCANFQRFKGIEFPNTEYNCNNDLFNF
jgi:uncharacterized protein YxeA